MSTLCITFSKTVMACNQIHNASLQGSNVGNERHNMKPAKGTTQRAWWTPQTDTHSHHRGLHVLEVEIWSAWCRVIMLTRSLECLSEIEGHFTLRLYWLHKCWCHRSLFRCMVASPVVGSPWLFSLGLAWLMIGWMVGWKNHKWRGWVKVAIPL